MGRPVIYTEEERKQRLYDYWKKYREANKERLNAYCNEKMKEYYKNCEEYREKQIARFRAPGQEKRPSPGRPRKEKIPVCITEEVQKKKRGRPRKVLATVSI